MLLSHVRERKDGGHYVRQYSCPSNRHGSRAAAAPRQLQRHTRRCVATSAAIDRYDLRRIQWLGRFEAVSHVAYANPND